MTSAQISIDLQSRGSAEIGKMRSDLKALGDAQERTDAQIKKSIGSVNQFRDSQIAAAKASRDWIGAQKLVNTALNDSIADTTRYNRLLAEQARIGDKLASKPKSNTLSSLLGGVGVPALSAAGAAGAVVGAAVFGANQINESNKLKASIDQTNASVSLQIRSFRSQTEVMAQAREYANRYKITQQELAPALLASTAILRESKAPVEEILGTLQRLSAASPEQGLEGAALAIKELQSGDTQSLIKRFEISRDRANEMKDAIKGGADAVEVLSDYLTESGLGMEALDLRTQGAAGKMNELKKAQEDFQLALAKATETPYIFFIELQTEAAKRAESLFSGEAQEVAKRQIKDQYGELQQTNNPLLNLMRGGRELFLTVNNARSRDDPGVKEFYDQIAAEEKAAEDLVIRREKYLLGVNNSYELVRDAVNRNVTPDSKELRDGYDSAEKSVVAAANAELLASKERDLKRDIDLAATGMLGQGDQVALLAAKYRYATEDAQLLIDVSKKAQQDADYDNKAVAAFTNGRFTSVASLNASKKAEEDRAERARQLQDSQLAYAKSTGDTVGVQAILNARLAEARGNKAEELKIQAELFQLNKSAQSDIEKAGERQVRDAKELLQLKERTYDAQIRQRDAALGASTAEVENRRKTREERRDLAQAQRVLQTGNAEQKQAAQERIELIDLERQKRANDIEKQRRESTGSIIDGQIYSSQQAGRGGGGRPIDVGNIASSVVPVGAGAQGGAGGAQGGTGLTVNVVIDGQIVGTSVLPHIVSALRNSLDQALATGA